MSEAIFGLVGVIVGAVVTGGVDFALTWRGERRETRRARRLMANEVGALVANFERSLRAGRTPDVGLGESAVFFPVVEWSQHKSTLAATVSDETWNDLASFYYHVGAARVAFEYLGHNTAFSDLVRGEITQTAAMGRQVVKELGFDPDLLSPVKGRSTSRP